MNIQKKMSKSTAFGAICTNTSKRGRISGKQGERAPLQRGRIRSKRLPESFGKVFVLRPTNCIILPVGDATAEMPAQHSGGKLVKGLAATDALAGIATLVPAVAPQWRFLLVMACCIRYPSKTVLHL